MNNKSELCYAHSIKMDEELIDNTPSGNDEDEVAETDVRNDIDENETPPDEYDYFTPALCYVGLLAHNTEPSHVYSASKVCRLFNQILEPRIGSASLALVLSILLPFENHWTSKSVLICRRISKQVQQAVDHSLVEVQPNCFVGNFTFQDETKMQSFLEHAQQISANGNAVLIKCFRFSSLHDRSWRLSLQLLENYGHSLCDFKTVVKVGDPRLLQALGFLQNISHLNVVFWTNCDDNFDVSRMAPFPPLPKLKRLSLLYFNNQELTKAAPFFYTILQTYGAQLEKFSCSEKVILSGFTSDNLSSLLPNLMRLRINHLYSESTPVFRILAKVSLPKLEELCLQFREDFSDENVELWKAAFQAFDNFSGSLKKLAFIKYDHWPSAPHYSFNNAALSELAVTHEVFPNLKELALSASHLDSPMWPLFYRRFPNLERLCFREDYDMNYPKPENSHVFERDFFPNFPNLQYILWPRQDNKFYSVFWGKKYYLYSRNGKNYEVFRNRWWH
ncbi:hypothetical protein Ocin01_08338 [Orchesella cincta]|uniref:Uncharacterized protein n=1 Tax=Orchesella cincta TaxID=48709 RepID=A0A1D2MZA3_ORCCI|nr:hypothetical protein Ocin01_08338 [Orchesella cincta]